MKDNNQKVSILLCVYNGDAYLKEQLESLLNQSIAHIDVWASDDQSSDNSLSILQSYQQIWSKGRFEILTGPQQGFAANFLALICNKEIKSEYYAYCDQDDIWGKDKLKRAINFLKSKEESPALYCSRTQMVNEFSKSTNHLSPLFKKKPSFANAIVQSLAGGNTMVLNSMALKLVRLAGQQEIVSHDWWTYILVTGAGGTVIYDPKPSILYRQHANNLIGANGSFSARMNRVRMLLKGEFREWTSIHIKALQDSRVLLTSKNKKTLEYITSSQQEGILKRLSFFKKSTAHRQTLAGNIGLWLAVLLKKI